MWGGVGGDVGMPPGGGARAGLAQWMSLMAEHMNQDPKLHPSFMWPSQGDPKMSPQSESKGKIY